MGGCVSLLLVFVGVMLASSVMTLALSIAGLLFVIGVVTSVALAIVSRRRRAEGRTLGALVLVPIVLLAVSVPALVVAVLTWRLFP